MKPTPEKVVKTPKAFCVRLSDSAGKIYRWSIRRVYTRAYNAFMLGGSCHHFVSFEVGGVGPFDLGKGYKGYLITAPDGTTFVAESATGALVGPSIQKVRADIQDASAKVMREQIAQAKKDIKQAKPIPTTKAWGMMGVAAK